jgi:hypothetical protein
MMAPIVAPVIVMIVAPIVIPADLPRLMTRNNVWRRLRSGSRNVADRAWMAIAHDRRDGARRLPEPAILLTLLEPLLKLLSLCRKAGTPGIGSFARGIAAALESHSLRPVRLRPFDDLRSRLNLWLRLLRSGRGTVFRAL